LNEENEELLLDLTFLTDAPELLSELPSGVGLSDVEGDSREWREQGSVRVRDHTGEVLNLVVPSNGVEHRLKRLT